MKLCNVVLFLLEKKRVKLPTVVSSAATGEHKSSKWRRWFLCLTSKKQPLKTVPVCPVVSSWLDINSGDWDELTLLCFHTVWKYPNVSETIKTEISKHSDFVR